MGTADHIKVRQADQDDIPALVELNRIAYPELATYNVVWGESHLRSHQQVFPTGQLVAELDGRIVDAVATLVVDMARHPLRQHTWAGITDSGYFTNHDPSGDTLYGADIYVAPDCRRMGVGKALYEARRDLCRKLNKRRILAGGRLVGFQNHPEIESAEEYSERVVRKEITDPVLSFQLEQGFVLRGVLRNYLKDPQSRNHASLIEWISPDYRPKKTGESRKVRVACIQYHMRKVSSFEEFARQVSFFVVAAAEYDTDFILLPELLTMQLLSQTDAITPKEGIIALTEYTDRYRDLMSDLARTHDVTIIAGSHPVAEDGSLLNICHICLPSGKVVSQPKIHITPNERKWWGIDGGNQLSVISTPTAKIGVQICYDIEFPEPSRFLADQGAEIIFVPFCTDNRQGYLRVRYCAQARAVENQVYVALAGNVGNLPDVPNMDVQYAQAAVLTPSDFSFARDGIAAEADSNEETILVCDLDLDDLHEARSEGTVTPSLDRRTDLFKIVTKFSGAFNESNNDLEGPLGFTSRPPAEGESENSVPEYLD